MRTVPYRGTRTYVHGTSLFALLSGELGLMEMRDIDFRLNRRIDSNRLRLVQNVEDRQLSTFACSLRCKVGDMPTTLAVEELNLPDSKLRDNYDEASYVERSGQEGSSIELHLLCKQEYAVEALVALNKTLLRKVAPVPKGCQYVFTRLELQRVPIANSNLELTFRRRLGSSHYLSQVSSEGSTIGMLHFSHWGP